MPTKTELIWDGKYDAIGKRVAPLRVALPFQTVETVNERHRTARKACFNTFRRISPGAIGSSGATKSMFCHRCSPSSPAR
jgi:hypothetical protein